MEGGDLMAEVNGIAAVGGGMTAGGFSAYQSGSIARHQELKPEQGGKEQAYTAKEAERRAPEREDVIAVSRDGDTVQAGKEALQQLREEEELGRVVEKGSLLTALLLFVPRTVYMLNTA